MRPYSDPSEKYRFPDTPEKIEAIRFHVLNPISRGTDPDDCLVFVRDFLRKAKDLVADFEDIANTYGRRAAARRLEMASNPNQQLPSNRSQQLAFRPSPTSFTPQPLNRANAASSYSANNSAINVSTYSPASGSRPPPPIFQAQPRNVSTYTPASASRPPAPIFQGQPRNVNTGIPASASRPPAPDFNAQPQLPSNEVSHPHDTQHVQDDGGQDDVQNLLVLSEVNIPPSQRKQTPRQMSCDLTEHQRIGLTWLLEQEKDRNKKGGLLAGLSQISSQLS